MGFLNDIFGFKDNSDSALKKKRSLRNRICRIEEIEPRELLSATPYEAPDPINVGIVYHEDYYEGLESDKGDQGGDTFVIAWNGGAAGTTLDKVVIDLSKSSEYPNSANIHFNVDGRIPNRDGTFYAFDADLPENKANGITIKSISVSEDGKTLTIEFDGFTSDKTFYFKIDVDEIQGEDKPNVDRLVTGNEMEGAVFSGTFSAANYAGSEFAFRMIDYYSDEMAGKLGLPPDAYYSDRDDHDNTAGALGTLNVQKPLSGSISGFVYEDDNNDGVKDSGEAGIPDVWLELYILNENGRYESTNLKTQTDANGFYIFEGIEGGRTYMVVETQPTAYVDGLDTPGTIDGVQVGVARPTDEIAAIHIGANENGVNYNFGELRRASISGYVYHDRNNNGQRETGEEGIADVTLKLQILNEYGVYVDVVGATVTTDANGFYIFNGLDPFQTYRVVETQPEGWSDGKDTVGKIGDRFVGNASQNDRIGAIEIKAGESGTEYNFGEFKKGSIGGFVYEDNDNDGIFDPDEPGIPGVTVFLCVVNEKGEKVTIASTVTDENGHYFFGDLEPGYTYCVTEVDPEGYCDGITSVGTIDGKTVGSINENVSSDHDQIHDIYIGSGEDGVNYNFAENRRGMISGYVYADENENGVRDVTEKGIADVTLTLWVWDGEKYVKTSQTATTDENGYYEFTGLCPFKTYRIVETQPEGFDDGEESVGLMDGIKTGTLPENDVISDILLPPGGLGTEYNFGELIPPVPEPIKGSLSGHVYVDANKNGSKDSGEVGIPNVTLTLWLKVNGAYVQVGTTTTDSNGYYKFSDLDPNETYMITETQPTAYDDGAETVGSLGGDKSENDKIKEILVGEDQHGTNYNFGELVKPTPDPATGSLSGYVYVDANKNGVKDSGEIGIAGATLALWKIVDGQYVFTGLTTTTDSNGYYSFTNLDPNEMYMIVEYQPAGYNDGQETVGSLGGDKSENDKIKGISVGEDQHGVNYNFGELIPDTPETPNKPVTPYFPPLGSNYQPRGAVGQGGGLAPTWQAPTINSTLQSGYGGGGLPSGFSWHLSVVNAGYPRSSEATAQGLVASRTASQQTMILDGDETDPDAKTKYVSVAWTPMPMNQSVWYVRDKDGKLKRRFMFGPDGGRPVVGDFNGDGIDEIAVFHDGNWYIDINGNGIWDEEDLLCQLGTSADQPVVGDWDGDGKADIGIFGPQWAGDERLVVDEPGLPSDLNPTMTVRPKNMPPEISIDLATNNFRAMRHSEGGQTRLDIVDHVFQYGGEGDKAFTGDFSGDGVKKVGIYRNGKWYIDRNGNGQWDAGDIYVDQSELGFDSSAIPVIGDFNGDGIDNIGLYVNGVWHLDTTGDFQFDTQIEFGQPGDYPIVGDFTGDGIAQLALYRSSGMDSLQTRSMPSTAPAVSVGQSSPLYADNAAAPEAARARIAPQVADQYGETGAADSGGTGQGTLPEQLQRHERTMHTPHSNVPLRGN